MALILNIETATDVCSVALATDGELICIKEDNEGKSHASLLTVFIEEIFKEHNLSASALNAVAVSKGPGSYTGLRIGVSTAKGICYGKGIPLIAINTLQSMAFGVTQKVHQATFPFDPKQAWYCPMLDARRMEVYAAFYNIENRCVQEVSADIIENGLYNTILEERPVLFFGNGSEKCKQEIVHPNAFFQTQVSLSAKTMMLLSEKAYQEKEFEDTAYVEPFYLKDFVATISKKNIF